jgi:hypothetical protein
VDGTGSGSCSLATYIQNNVAASLTSVLFEGGNCPKNGAACEDRSEQTDSSFTVIFVCLKIYKCGNYTNL